MTTGKKIFYILILFLIIGSFLAWMIPLGSLLSLHKSKTTTSTLKNLTTTTIMKKKIAFVIAFNNFRDEEYFVPKEILENAGYAVVTVSEKKGTARGADGGETVVMTLPNEVDPEEYEALVFAGGPGMARELDNSDFQELVKEFVRANKLVAAICIAPALLAKSGILQGKKATVWSSALDKSPVRILEENGAIYEDRPVVQDGKIITANGPTAAKEFGSAIVKALKESTEEE